MFLQPSDALPAQRALLLAHNFKQLWWEDGLIQLKVGEMDVALPQSWSALLFPVPQKR